MSNVTAKLKGLDYKELLLAHVEKIVLGLVALLALSAVFGARWTTAIEEAPKDLTTDVDQARQSIEAADWPEDEQNKFVDGQDVRERARKMLTALDGSRFEYKTAMSFPLYEKEEPIQRIDWQPLDEPIATSGRVILAQLPEGTPPGGLQNFDEGSEGVQPGTAPLAQSAPARSALEEDFGRPTQRGAATPGAATPGFSGPGGGHGGATTPLPSPTAGPGGGHGGGLTGANANPQMAYGSQRGGTMQAAGNGRGARYIAVRAVWPWKQQVENVQKAMHADHYTKVADLVEILNFELERQTALGGGNKWSDWEPVSQEVAMDILQQAEDFDPDEVESGVINDVMTMPLPRRIGGYWGSRATHPQIKNFRLSHEAMQRELLINQKIVEQFQRMKANEPQQVRREGFARLQHDIGGMRRQVMGSSYAQQFQEQLRADIKDPEQLKQILFDELQQRATAIGNLLLFRYLDFDVEPGHAYRYRVRLILRNPNFDRPVDQLEDPALREGETRTTPWSPTTQAVVIKPDVDYFLAKVEAPRARPDEPEAYLDVYQWSPETGTMLNQQLPTMYGQIIGGESATVFLDPARGIYEEEEQVDFDTGDYLIDMLDAPQLNDKYHPDLALTDEDQRIRLGIPDEALVMTEYGAFVHLDPITDQAAHAYAAERVQSERDYFASLKRQAPATGGYGFGGEGEGELGGLDEAAQEYYEAMMQEQGGYEEEEGDEDESYGSGYRGRGGYANPLRKRSPGGRGPGY